MAHEIQIKDLSALDAAAGQFLREMEGCSVVAFHGAMGAGKTTLIAALCRRLGVEEDAVASPTFALVNEYRTRAGRRICHFDFYRIASEAEALDLGFYEYVDSGDLCLIEWPENISSLLPPDTLHVWLEADSREGFRHLRF